MCGGCSVPYWTTRAWRGCGLYVLWCGQLAYGAERWICATSRCVVVGHACRCVCAHAAALIAAIDGCAGTDLRAGGWCLTCMVCVRTTSGAVCDGEQVLPRAPVVSAARVPMRCELCRYENDVTRPSARHVYRTSPYSAEKIFSADPSIGKYIPVYKLIRVTREVCGEPTPRELHTSRWRARYTRQASRIVAERFTRCPGTCRVDLLRARRANCMRGLTRRSCSRTGWSALSLCMSDRIQSIWLMPTPVRAVRRIGCMTQTSQ